jgi:hypothetical protein
MSGKEDEGTVLRTLSGLYPTLKDLRAAAPKDAERFLAHTQKNSENWPIESLIDGYLDAIP